MNVNAILKRLKEKKSEVRAKQFQLGSNLEKIKYRAATPVPRLMQKYVILQLIWTLKKEELSAVDKITTMPTKRNWTYFTSFGGGEGISVPSMTEDIPTKQTNMFGNEEMSEEGNLLEYYNNLIKAKELQKNSVDDK